MMRISRTVAIVAFMLAGSTHELHALEDGAPRLFQESYAAEATGDVAAAVAALRRLPIDRREHYFYQLRLGWLLYLSEQYPASAVAYRRAIALAPEAVEPRLGLLLPLMANRMWSDAEQTARAALSIDDGNYLATSRLAFILFNQGRYAEAAAQYRRVLDFYPADLEMRAGLGWSLARSGKLSLAQSEFEEILGVAPSHVSARGGVDFVRSATTREP